MAVKTFNLPVCDQCGKSWLPDEGPARDDIRAYDAKERAKGLKGKPVRCGKCKSTKWDENYRKNGHDLVHAQPEIPKVTAEDVAQTIDLPGTILGRSLGAVVSVPARPALCRHRVLNCPICTASL